MVVPAVCIGMDPEDGRAIPDAEAVACDCTVVASAWATTPLPTSVWTPTLAEEHRYRRWSAYDWMPAARSCRYVGIRRRGSVANGDEVIA